MTETVRLGVRRVKAPTARRLGVEKELEWGVYDRGINGGRCPECNRKGSTTHTKEPIGNTRLRYHKCGNPKCKTDSFKTLEEF